MEIVPADHARTLERELAAMTKDRDSWRQQNNDRVADLLKMSSKRDRLLAALAYTTGELNSVQADLNDLRIAYKERGEERNELRAKMECYDPYFRELDLLRHERDALKAENERLRAELTKYKWHVAGHPVGMAIGNQTMPSCDICNTASDGVALVCKERDALKAENEGLANLLWEHSKAPTDQDSVFASMDRVIELRKENERLRAELASWKRSVELERLKLNVLKESRAAAVEQEQVSRNECNRIRGHLLMIANECNCRAEHGAEGSDHLLAIEKMLREALK